MKIYSIASYQYQVAPACNRAKVNFTNLSEVASGLTKVMERKSGNVLETTFIKCLESSEKLLTLLDQQSRIIGQCHFEHSKNDIRITNLSSIKGDRLKGIGSRLMDEVFLYSLGNGFGGRIQLYASNYHGLLPKPYLNKEHSIPSPVPFYLKYGLVPHKTSYPQNIPNFDFKTLKECEMSLPHESILKIKSRLGI